MFQSVEFNDISKLSLILRVGGSLGEFTPELGDGNPGVERGVLVCKVVIRDHGWEQRSDTEIKAIIAVQLKSAMAACCQFLNMGTEVTGQVLGALAQLAVQRDGHAFGVPAR